MLEAESAVACCRDHNSFQIDGVGFVHHDQSMLWQDVGTQGAGVPRDTIRNQRLL